MRKKLVLIAVALAGGLVTSAASAMPIAPVPIDGITNIENVRWVCGPYRCWWRPNYYYGGGYGAYGGYGYYAPRYYGGWGYRRGWHGRRW